MIIKCPNCRKQISNKRKVCPHCSYSMETHEVVEQADREEVRASQKLKYRIEMQTYAAILVTSIGVVWMYRSSDGFTLPSSYTSIACLAAGALWYLGLRIYMIIKKLK